MHVIKIMIYFIGKQFDKILASGNIIRQVPRFLGPTLSKMGKFPTAIRPNETVEEKISPLKKSVKLSVKFKVGSPQCLSAGIGHVQMTEKEITENVTAAINFTLTLMKKGWQNIKKIHIKSTMGPPFTIFGL